MTQPDRPYQPPVQPPAGGQPAPYGPSGFPPGNLPPGSPPGSYPQAGFPPGYPVPAWARQPDPMPTAPVEYQHMLRGPRHRWWRPLVTVLLCAALAVAVQVITGLVVGGVLVATGTPVSDVVRRISTTSPMAPLTFAVVIISLVSLIPSAMLANWIVNGVRPGYLSSVAGRFRWRWFARCLVITVPIFVIFVVLQVAFGQEIGPRPQHWVILLIMVIIGIPFQSAGEEYAFRGLVLQNVGSWFGRPKVALVAAMIPSVIVFALAHGSFDPWVFADLAIFALASCFVAWRTGGLESSVALHASNNVTLMIATLLFGGWDQAFVSSNTVGSPIAPLATLIVNGICIAVILWQARRVRLQRTYQRRQPQTAPAGYPARG
ncbi:CPBP family intramembrane glutamic endopeptidase [Microlunatus sp. Gsoil 973]|uniref:CPBP family intramembrane glutamic endopeptidase n=1 Tax=Microlunatus sp. Gsoil 973 TaxID=2672569 RepID=UPI0018A86D56|nr:CPBP family intramembrane glutamic endopeptidase [Microlunatus sp. Gsoil 973]